MIFKAKNYANFLLVFYSAAQVYRTLARIACELIREWTSMFTIFLHYICFPDFPVYSFQSALEKINLFRFDENWLIEKNLWGLLIDNSFFSTTHHP